MLIVSDEKVTTFAEALVVVKDMEMNILTKDRNTDFAPLEIDSDLQKIFVSLTFDNWNDLSYIE
jgi:hypothetical protein